MMRRYKTERDTLFMEIGFSFFYHIQGGRRRWDWQMDIESESYRGNAGYFIYKFGLAPELPRLP